MDKEQQWIEGITDDGIEIAEVMEVITISNKPQDEEKRSKNLYRQKQTHSHKRTSQKKRGMGNSKAQH